MPKILFNQGKKLNINKKQVNNTGFVSDTDIYKKRSKHYMDVIKSLDHDNLTTTKGMTELIETITNEFGLATVDRLPIGIVSKCFLGDSYEVHTLNLIDNHIIKHFKKNEPMPAAFEKARNLAIHNAYAMVEIYKDKMVLIREDGSAIKM